MTDFTLYRAPPVFVITPNTPAAAVWLEAHVLADSWQWFGTSLNVNARTAADLTGGMITEGFTLATR